MARNLNPSLAFPWDTHAKRKKNRPRRRIVFLTPEQERQLSLVGFITINGMKLQKEDLEPTSAMKLKGAGK